MLYTKDRLFKEFYDPDKFTLEELEYILTMVFPDVRTKQFIEIRMGDVLPYPLNMSYLALWKGLLYNKENLNYLYDTVKKYNKTMMRNIKLSIKNKGLNTKIEGMTVLSYFKKLLDLAAGGLTDNEKYYLQPLQKIISKNLIPKQITFNQLNKGKNEALNWCILNNLKRWEENACRCIF